MDINKLKKISAQVREERRSQMIRDVEQDVIKSDPAGIAVRLMAALEDAALNAAMDGKNEATASEIIYRIVRPSTPHGVGKTAYPFHVLISLIIKYAAQRAVYFFPAEAVRR